MKIFKNLFKLPAKKHIKPYGNIFSLFEKEQKIFKQSNKQLKARKLYLEIEWPLYNFQMLVECLNKNRQKLKISERNIELLNTAYEDLSLVGRFFMIGYYNTSHRHLRSFVESSITFAYEQNRQKYGFKKTSSFSGKIKSVSCDKYYFNQKEFYKIFAYLSKYGAHKSIKTSDISYDSREFKRSIILMLIVIVMVSRFIKICLGEGITKKHLSQRIENPVAGEKEVYWSYVTTLFNDSPSYLFNLMFTYGEDIKKFIKNDLNFDENELFEKEYLESHKEYL